MSEMIMTMFSEEDPCWTAELLKLAGEDISGLDGLVSNGFLELSDGIYSLTEAGRNEYDRLKNELFLEGAPGRKPTLVVRDFEAGQRNLGISCRSFDRA